MSIQAIGKIGSLPPKSLQADEEKKLKKACQDFEGIMINMMLKSMRQTLPGSDIFGNSMGKEIYRSMYDQELSEKIAKGENNLGLGEALYRDLSKKMDP
jgi:flagellar protein FlgJ